jgi:SAM-dependent methyltransferase
MDNALQRLNRAALGFMEAKLLFAAASLRLFDQLRGDGGTAPGVAARLGAADPRGVEILLDALVSAGYVRKAGAVYTNEPEYEPYLVEDGPTHHVAGMRHRNRLFRHWAFLEDRILGRPLPPGILDRATQDDPQENENFIRAMYAYSHQGVGAVLDTLDLSGVSSVADLGGGPAHYLAEFGRRLPHANLYLVDLPLTLEVARRVQAGTPEFPRMRFVAWNFYEDAPPRDLPRFDVVLLSQVIHSEGPDANRALFRRIRPLLAPGGTLVVNERTVDATRTAPREAAFFAVNMFVMTEDGRSYTEDEIAGWAADAGLRAGRSVRISDVAHVLTFVS